MCIVRTIMKRLTFSITTKFKELFIFNRCKTRPVSVIRQMQIIRVRWLNVKYLGANATDYTWKNSRQTTYSTDRPNKRMNYFVQAYGTDCSKSIAILHHYHIEHRLPNYYIFNLLYYNELLSLILCKMCKQLLRHSGDMQYILYSL